MNGHTSSLILLTMTIGCAAEDRGTELSAGTSATPQPTRASTGSGEIVRSSDTVRILHDLPRTADGGPIPGDGTFLCASEANNFDGFMPQTILLEATRTRAGLQVHTMRTDLHDTESEPISESEELLTEFSWSADRIALSVAVERTEITLENVPGTAGRLFIGSGTSTHAESLSFTCWDERVSPRFTYDGETGLCTDSEGREGLNPWTMEMVRETGEAECADLRGVALEEGDFSKPRLTGWNLRGAVLDDASIHFAIIEDAQLHGADLSGLSMGYAHVSGDIDGFTQLPEAHCDTFFDASIMCVL